MMFNGSNRIRRAKSRQSFVPLRIAFAINKRRQGKEILLKRIALLLETVLNEMQR